jgi:hypothetical protein
MRRYRLQYAIHVRSAAVATSFADAFLGMREKLRRQRMPLDNVDRIRKYCHIILRCLSRNVREISPTPAASNKLDRIRKYTAFAGTDAGNGRNITRRRLGMREKPLGMREELQPGDARETARLGVREKLHAWECERDSTPEDARQTSAWE